MTKNFRKLLNYVSILIEGNLCEADFHVTVNVPKLLLEQRKNDQKQISEHAKLRMFLSCKYK